MRKLLLGLIAFLPFTLALAAPVTSGDYDGLLIGVDRQGTLTGYFESSTGNGQFSCIFFIKGKVSSASTHVETWYPDRKVTDDVIPGQVELEVEKGKTAIRIKLKTEHGGCWNVQPFASEPAVFVLDQPGSWEAIRVVAAKKAYFYDSPSDTHPRKAYVVERNVLRVFETKSGWVRADYVNGVHKHYQGWIAERDLYSTEIPAKK